MNSSRCFLRDPLVAGKISSVARYPELASWAAPLGSSKPRELTTITEQIPINAPHEAKQRAETATFLVKSFIRPKKAKIEPPASVNRRGIKVIVTGVVESPPYGMKAKNFEQRFDEGIELIVLLELSRGTRVLQQQRRVNIVPATTAFKST